MIEALISGLQQVLAWPAFGFLLIGAAVGFVVGILPGLGGLATLALMLPFAYKIQEPISAFAFLLGMHAITGTTGDLTSILFGIPGEGTATATIMDGYPMTKRGEAGRAMGAALMSSLVGGLEGALILALSIPIMRPLVLFFGSPELFMLAVLGITFIASLSGTSITKGMLAGGIGLMLAAIGVDPQSGTLRYTMGTLYLWDGLSLAPVVVGFFAIPEIVDLAVRGTSIAEAKVDKIQGVMEGVKDTFRHFWLTMRCGMIGIFIGALPGLGGGVSQWMAYGHAVQSSKDRSRFGKGAVEGVLGPGAANNSKEGGNLIPTVAFGIPGSSAMAILLGAFLIVGLDPGPEMLNKHLDITFAMVWILVIANIITASVCFLFLNQIVKITFVRGNLLIPFLLMFVFLGSFAAHNNLSDIIVTLTFGLLGYVMILFEWPRPPFVLGLVLGRIAENYLWISTSAYGPSWLLHPSIIVIILIILTTLGFSIFKSKKREDQSLNSEGG
ncbi:MAG: tripartite tricarboxylate transporter permease [Desulfatiglandales bacterium]